MEWKYFRSITGVTFNPASSDLALHILCCPSSGVRHATWWTVPTLTAPGRASGWQRRSTNAPGPPLPAAYLNRSPSCLMSLNPMVSVRRDEVFSYPSSERVTPKKPLMACSRGTDPRLPPLRLSPECATSSRFKPSGSEKEINCSSKRSTGPVKPTPCLLRRSSQYPTLPRGIEKEVVVTCPAPFLPRGALGHGKNVRIVPGWPSSSP